MHTIIPLLLLLVGCQAAAQSISTRIGARATAMGNAGFTLTDPSSLFHNPAALAFLDDPALIFGYEIVPALPGADRRVAAISWPFPFGTIAAGAFRFGDEFYSEQFITAGVSHRIDHTGLALKVNVIQYRTDQVGVQSALTFDVAGLTQLTSEWSIGAGIFNVGQAELTPEEPLPVIFVAATSWKAPEGIMLIAEVEKKLESPMVIRAGMEGTIHKKIFARAGIATNPLVLSGGVGAKASRLQLDFSASYQSMTSFYYQASAACRILKQKR